MKKFIAVLVVLMFTAAFAQDIPQALDQQLNNVITSAGGLVVACPPEFEAAAAHPGVTAQKTLCANIPDFYLSDSAIVLRSSVDLEFAGTDWMVLAPWAISDNGLISKAFYTMDSSGNFEAIAVYVASPMGIAVFSAETR